MTKEQEEAIEIVKKYLNFNEICGTRNFKDALDTVLSMLKENSAEIEKKNTELAEKNAEIEKKDEIIDLMADYIFQNIDVEEDICNSVCVECKQETAQDITCINCIKQYFNCIKQYFERKATNNG